MTNTDGDGKGDGDGKADLAPPVLDHPQIEEMGRAVKEVLARTGKNCGFIMMVVELGTETGVVVPSVISNLDLDSSVVLLEETASYIRETGKEGIAIDHQFETDK